MDIMLASRSSLPFLVLLSLARAATLEDKSLYHVVEDLPGIETQRPGKELVATCSEIMAQNGLDFSSFWQGAAHGLYSLHLEEIRHFFEPNATKNNNIPFVNKNLSSEQIILSNAPLAGYDEQFNTMALKVMAYFMRNDSPDFFQRGLNTLEKVTRQYHMHEIYAAAAPIYSNMKENLPLSTELCACVNDIRGNGILVEMANIARQLKGFQSKRTPRQCLTCQPIDNTYVRPKPRRLRPYATGIEVPEPRGLHPVAQIFIPKPALEVPKPHGLHPVAAPLDFDTDIITKREADDTDISALKVVPDQWVSYGAMLTSSMLEADQLKDFATFMYCRLNQPDIDQ